MKLRNKETGEIAIKHIAIRGHNEVAKTYNSLVELNEEWEDYEELKKYYYITSCGEITHRGYRLWENESVYDKKRKEIGNYFEAREEAEKAVEKLKAWKRLKDKGFRFVEGWLDNNDDFIIKAKLGTVGLIDQPDVNLLFGGEE